MEDVHASKIIMDLDGTLTRPDSSPSYALQLPRDEVVERLREFHGNGFEIAIQTARGMRTHGANVGRVAAQTLPTIVAWLDRHSIPYDELYVGKPWCGPAGFYVDDRALRPSEFACLSEGEIRRLLQAS